MNHNIYKFINELKSDNYYRGHGQLCQKRNGRYYFNVCGITCETAIKCGVHLDMREENHDIKYYDDYPHSVEISDITYNGNKTMIPVVVRKFFGLNISEIQNLLVRWDSIVLPFSQIADIIDAHAKQNIKTIHHSNIAG